MDLSPSEFYEEYCDAREKKDKETFVEKFGDYLKNHNSKGMILFRKIFPCFRYKKFNFRISVNLTQFNRILSMHFPMKLWGLFRYDMYVNQIEVKIKDLDTILKFLELDEEFKSPERVDITPHQLQICSRKLLEFQIQGDIAKFNVYDQLNVSKF